MTDKQALAWEVERRRREQFSFAQALDDFSDVIFGAELGLLLVVVARVLLF